MDSPLSGEVPRAPREQAGFLGLLVVGARWGRGGAYAPTYDGSKKPARARISFER